MKILGFNSSSFRQFFSRTSDVEPVKSQIVTKIVQEKLTTSQPARHARQRNDFFERISSTVSIRSFNEAHQYLRGLDSTLENLTSIRTCRALERVVIKTVRQGASRNALLQNIENVRRERAHGRIHHATLELCRLLAEINATPKAEVAPSANANMFVLRRFARQNARVDRKNEIVEQLAGQVILAHGTEQLKCLRNGKNQHQEANCLTGQVIDIFLEGASMASKQF